MCGELFDLMFVFGFYCCDGDDLDFFFVSVKVFAEVNVTALVFDVRSAIEAKAFDVCVFFLFIVCGCVFKDDEFYDWEFF